MDLIFNLTRSAPAADSVFQESTLVPSYFSKNVYEGKQPSWYGSVQHILQNMPSLTNFLTTFKYKCNKIVKQHYLELWTKQAHSLKEGKLRTYLKIKKTIIS
jgi:hypothetical protein